MPDDIPTRLRRNLNGRQYTGPFQKHYLGELLADALAETERSAALLPARPSPTDDDLALHERQRLSARIAELEGVIERLREQNTALGVRIQQGWAEIERLRAHQGTADAQRDLLAAAIRTHRDTGGRIVDYRRNKTLHAVLDQIDAGDG